MRWMEVTIKRGKRIWLPLFLIHLVLYTSCSAYTDFVVVNESDNSLKIQYKVKKSTAGPLATSGIPATIEASKLRTYGGTQWEKLSSGQYQLVDDPEVDVVIIRLEPKKALRLTAIRSERDDSTCDGGPGFPVTEILIAGANGKLELTGNRAQTGFSKSSRGLCVITYN
jgi:hypothetical protein